MPAKFIVAIWVKMVAVRVQERPIRVDIEALLIVPPAIIVAIGTLLLRASSALGISVLLRFPLFWLCWLSAGIITNDSARCCGIFHVAFVWHTLLLGVVIRQSFLLRLLVTVLWWSLLLVLIFIHSSGAGFRSVVVITTDDI